MAKTTIRIANAGGYWGDDPSALYRQIQGGQLDYITMDFLAEVTMSILRKQQSRFPELGYAKDFVSMLEPVLRKAMQEGTTIISNAGGVNPSACAQAIYKLADKLSLKPKIAIVYGDDIMNQVDVLHKQGHPFKNLETGADFSSVHTKLCSANVYFGARPVVTALDKWKPDIIVTGRVTDTGITLAPMIHEFSWSWEDWDKLANGIVAGHLLECGSQVCGGNFSDWHKVKNFNAVGYPIAEVGSDASFTLTKHPDSGGLVSVDTIREQLFYEMGHPKAYITPDVVVDFSSIKLREKSIDQVEVSGAKGFAPTESYKVSMAYQDGYKCTGSVIISGPEARAKAEKFAEIFWQRCEEKFQANQTEYFGWNACHRSLAHQQDGNEILLRLSAKDQDKEKLKRFSKLVPSLILSGPQELQLYLESVKCRKLSAIGQLF